MESLDFFLLKYSWVLAVHFVLTSSSIREHRGGTGWKVGCRGAGEADEGTRGSDQQLLGSDPLAGCSPSLSPDPQNGLRRAQGSMQREVINTVGKEGDQLGRERYPELLPPDPAADTQPMPVSLPVFIICRELCRHCTS